MEDERFTIRGSEPIFPVADVVATVSYYREVLGFAEGWTWGEPPDFGGVRWGKVGAMFALQSGPDPKIGGQWHSFFVEGIDALYSLHGRKGRYDLLAAGGEALGPARVHRPRSQRAFPPLRPAAFGADGWT